MADDWKEVAKKMLGNKYGVATIYTAGTFDLFHRGHINIFKKAKAIGNHLIVGVSTNQLIRSYKEFDPILNYKERTAIVKSVKYVDEIVKQTELFDVGPFQELGADLFIIGDDWANKEDIPEGLKWLKKHNKVLFVPNTKGLSTSIIKRKIIRQSYQIMRADITREIEANKTKNTR